MEKVPTVVDKNVFLNFNFYIKTEKLFNLSNNCLI